MSDNREEYDLFSMIQGLLTNKGSRSFVVLAVVFIFFLMLKPWVTVESGYRGVVLNFRAASDIILPPGLHFRMPIKQDIIPMNVQIQKVINKDARAASSDLQNVSSTVELTFILDPSNVDVIYAEHREYKVNIIDPALAEVVKAVTAKYTAENLITKREVVADLMEEELKNRLKKYHILVDAFSITEFSFSDKFDQAIEAKQTAEQNALKAERDLDRIRIEAEQTITRAKAETSSLRMQKEIISDKLLELRKIEANLKAIEKWDGHLPGVTGGAVPFIGVGGMAK